MKIKLIICIILFLNISCSKDDTNTNYKNKIIGKWSLVDDGSGTTISNTNSVLNIFELFKIKLFY